MTKLSKKMTKIRKNEVTKINETDINFNALTKIEMGTFRPKNLMIPQTQYVILKSHKKKEGIA